ncbi:GlcG/HbpS family heme-binding protein [Celeribacter litoreus]|uniref:GlcG/HbpS family heme-binding protein n=1 Tax=Celeribacter litoreus TaxID=2876714 RepID=UPI001CCBEB81|nr:heme-binding protein [Celeribacter litoreus]MCA0045231.1 heme-binding protein [Celeribacter litoreus]
MTEITLSQAQTIIATAMAHGESLGWNPLSVVVLDAGGHVQAFARADAAPPGRFDLAHAKAKGAVLMGLNGSELADRAERMPELISGARAAFGQLVALPGSVLVLSTEGAVIGAVGVAGDTPEHDAEAARAGITAAGLNARP